MSYRLGPAGRRASIEVAPGLHHVALFRGYLEGIPLNDLARLYLKDACVAGEVSSREAKATLEWIRREFILAARKYGQASSVRLLAFDPPAVTPTNLPSLDEFADLYGDFYTERDLLEKWTEEYGDAAKEEAKTAKRQRRIADRQIAAINRLVPYLIVEPKLEDPVGAWFARKVAAGLERAGISTLAQLVRHIANRGKRWHAPIARIGPTIARKIEGWCSDHAASLGLSPAPAAYPALPNSVVAGIGTVRAAELAITPIESLLVPEAISGRLGTNRAPRQKCRIDADDDLAAICSWLKMRREGSHTWRSYRTQAERFLLWSIFHRQKPLSSLTAVDCAEYRDWLRNPEPHDLWIGRKAVPRWSPEWRPFAGPLQERSIEVAVTILKALCGWLTRRGYLDGNPWEDVPKSDVVKGRDIDTTRSFSTDEWPVIIGYLKTLPPSPGTSRLKLLLSLGYTTGLRLHELAQLRLGALAEAVLPAVSGETSRCWVATVVGKGRRLREVPIPQVVMNLVLEDLEMSGLVADPAAWDPTTPLFRAQPRPGRQGGSAMTSSGIYRCLKDFFRICAETAFANNASAQRTLLRASTHWLRHTFGSHALSSGVEVSVVQEILGHQSLETTTVYARTDTARRRTAAETMAKQI